MAQFRFHLETLCLTVALLDRFLFSQADLLLPMDYQCYCLLSLFADWSCLSCMQYLVR